MLFEHTECLLMIRTAEQFCQGDKLTVGCDDQACVLRAQLTLRHRRHRNDAKICQHVVAQCARHGQLHAAFRGEFGTHSCDLHCSVKRQLQCKRCSPDSP